MMKYTITIKWFTKRVSLLMQSVYSILRTSLLSIKKYKIFKLIWDNLKILLSTDKLSVTNNYQNTS